MSVILQSSGGGQITIQEPTTASNFTQTLPASNGTIATVDQLGTGFRNRIINGNMRIDQRNNGASVSVTTATSGYSLDRWFYYNGTGDGDFTVQQAGTGLAGLPSSLKFTVTAADSSLGAGDYYLISQKIEGYNVADLGFGTASAKTITISFTVYSSVTGTFGGVLRNAANNRFYPFTYSIPVANTWTSISVTVAGDTTGTWETTTSTGIEVIFSLGTGVLGTAGSWSGTSALGATGQTNLMATLNATWYITGVQLEVGSNATPFDTRSYGTELALCQRYYQVLADSVYVIDTGANFVTKPRAVVMRASPTASGGGTGYVMQASASVLSEYQTNRSYQNMTYSAEL
jgi:hypothetical protein